MAEQSPSQTHQGQPRPEARTLFNTHCSLILVTYQRRSEQRVLPTTLTTR